jgi:hypothetical protein
LQRKNNLGQNLGILRQGYQPINCDASGNLIDISGEIRKLYDHVNLDIERISYTDKGDWRISGKAAVEEVQKQVSTLESQVDLAVEKMTNASKEYIAILGIFASIVIAFVSGISDIKNWKG